MTRSLHVTDHALIRYMERVLKLDMSSIRIEIGKRVAAAVVTGAETVTVDGVVYHLGIDQHRAAVVTVHLDVAGGKRPPPPSRQPTPENRSHRWHVHRRKRR